MALRQVMITDYEIIKFRDTMQRLIDKSTIHFKNHLADAFIKQRKEKMILVTFLFHIS